MVEFLLKFVIEDIQFLLLGSTLIDKVLTSVLVTVHNHSGCNYYVFYLAYIQIDIL